MVRSAQMFRHNRKAPDPSRIAGIATAIVVNLALFAVLMQPPSFTTIAPEPESTAPPPLIKVIPPKPPKPEPVPVERHLQHPQPPRPLPLPTPPPIPPVINPDPSPMGQQIPPQPPTPSHVDSGPTGPVETSLDALASPAPDYPRQALLDGITGTVELELLVDVDGHVLNVKVLRSSGDRRLDLAAREQVLRNWRFQPAMRDGVPVQALGRVPIVFSLDNR